MAMIFTMVSIIKEELDNIMLDVQKAEEEIIIEKRRQDEEAEHAKFVGTKVTVESFLEWKKKFDAQMLQKDIVLQQQRAKELKGKLSGRQLFEQDKSLASSDAQFLDEDEEEDGEEDREEDKEDEKDDSSV
jgi:hypothetical protein